MRNAGFVGTTPGNVSTALTRYFMTMSVDDQATGFSATHTKLNDVGTVTNEFDALLDTAVTISSQTITMVMTVPSSSSFDGATVKRIAIHDDTATNVTVSSTTLCGGIDGQTYAKVTNVALKFTVTWTAS